MMPALDDGDVRIWLADAIDGLRAMPDGLAQTCVTSPPYWGLRDYGADGQIGLEDSPDEFVARLVDVFREVRRVLRDDGTLWLNLGDSYAGAGYGNHAINGETWKENATLDKRSNRQQTLKKSCQAKGIKPKDLVGIPWRVAFALQADGWYLRSDIIWHKPNPMPESVTDRPTKSHEYVFLLSKSARYFYDADAIREPHRWQRPELVESNAQARQGLRLAQRRAAGDDSAIRTQPLIGRMKGRGNSGNAENEFSASELGRNARSVWSITTRPYAGAHFATFPPDLPERCIKAGSRAGDTVLDPFMGSGTTAWVARNLGRRAVGCELNAEYLAIAADRLRQLSLLANVVAAGDE